MIAFIRQWLDRVRRVRELENEIARLKAAAATMAVRAERDRALAVVAASDMARRCGMVLPDDSDGISAGTPAHVFLANARPRLCGIVDERPSIH